MEGASAAEVIKQHRRNTTVKKAQLEEEEDEEGIAIAPPAALVEEFDPEDYVRPGITQKEIMEMKASFDLLDHDCVSRISLEEAIEDMEHLGWDRLEQEPLMVALRVCKRKSDTMDFADFMDAMTPLLFVSEPTQESLRRSWRLLDDSRKGAITVEDIGRAVRQYGLELSAEELSDMISFADNDGSGEITFDEFYHLLSRTGRI
eukprot:TRINITY_DN60819_c0_g1_i1.p1 TRINITY_DN60819_c0_g1~~TRINITY_DN60819_c0_g1_i1.p1  ORF type:complete len:204 (-),score=48.13 TRINITY_DN60819_c0_g1_i1:166-777(-)